MARRYTKAEIDFIVKSKAEGWSYERIAAALGITKNAARHQWQYYQMSQDPEAREKYLQKRKEERERKGSTYRYRSIDGLSGRYYADLKIIVPDEVWADRERRLMEPRTLSMEMFGDPVPSQSALGKMCD